MHSSIGATIAIGSVTVLLAAFSGMTGLRAPSNEAAGTIVARDSAAIDSSAGTVTPHWISDANVLSVLTMMNQRQIAAADIELEAWHSDSARALAASIARDHAELQHSVDSAVMATHIAPMPSALSTQIGLEMQALVDTIIARRSVTLDRAFVRQQVASDAQLSSYLNQLTAVAERPEIQAVAAVTASHVSAQLERAQALQAAFAIADSAAAADSAVARSARAARAAARAARAARAAKQIHQ